MSVAEQLAQNHRAFLAFLERRLGDRALAEDILQDAFVKSIEKGEAVREESSAVAWFYRMLRNAVIDHHRRAATRSKALEGLAAEMKGATEPPPDMHSELCACLGTLLPSLKPEYAQAIQRVDLDELPVQDFAQEAGISANNAGVRVFRAREALRKQIRECCGTCAEHGCVDCQCDSSGARLPAR